MRTLSSKTLLAALNPSPVFEAVAIFAERLALNSDESRPNEIGMADNFAVPKRRGQMSARFQKDGRRTIDYVIRASRESAATRMRVI